MTAFWVGTLPALTTMLVGVQSLTPKMRNALPVAASLLLIVTGLYTVTGRAAVDVSSLTSPDLPLELTATSLIRLADEPLPCCSDGLQDDATTDQNDLPPCCRARIEADHEKATPGSVSLDADH